MRIFNFLFITILFLYVGCNRNTQKPDTDKSIINNNSLNLTKNMDRSDYKNCIKLDTISIPNHYEMMEYIKEKRNAIESDGFSIG